MIKAKDLISLFWQARNDRWGYIFQRRVEERIAAEGEAQEQPITGDELLTMIEEVL